MSSDTNVVLFGVHESMIRRMHASLPAIDLLVKGEMTMDKMRSAYVSLLVADYFRVLATRLRWKSKSSPEASIETIVINSVSKFVEQLHQTSEQTCIVNRNTLIMLPLFRLRLDRFVEFMDSVERSATAKAEDGNIADSLHDVTPGVVFLTSVIDVTRYLPPERTILALSSKTISDSLKTIAEQIDADTVRKFWDDNINLMDPLVGDLASIEPVLRRRVDADVRKILQRHHEVRCRLGHLCALVLDLQFLANYYEIDNLQADQADKLTKALKMIVSDPISTAAHSAHAALGVHRRQLYVSILENETLWTDRTKKLTNMSSAFEGLHTAIIKDSKRIENVAWFPPYVPQLHGARSHSQFCMDSPVTVSSIDKEMFESDTLLNDVAELERTAKSQIGNVW